MLIEIVETSELLRYISNEDLKMLSQKERAFSSWVIVSMLFHLRDWMDKGHNVLALSLNKKRLQEQKSFDNEEKIRNLEDKIDDTIIDATRIESLISEPESMDELLERLYYESEDYANLTEEEFLSELINRLRSYPFEVHPLLIAELESIQHRGSSHF